MKIFVILFTFGLLCCLTEAARSFDEFKARFYKRYRSKMQEEQSRKIFEKRIDRINKFNKRRDRTFKMEVNHLTDLTETQRKGLNGFQFSVFANTFLTKSSPIMARNMDQHIPDNFDWRKFGVVSPVQDQGFICGACWAFATTGHLESIIAIATNSSVVKLSEQQFIDCNRNLKIGNYGCDGGFMATSLAYSRFNDITTEKLYPYLGADSICFYNVSQTRFNFSQPIMIPSGDEEALKIAVALYGPITTAIDANQESLFGYSTGVYYEPQCTQWLNHAVLVVGYGTDKVGGDYWIIKNSWSSLWGENGYFRLARNRNNHCGISKYAVYVKLNKINHK